MSNQSGDRDFVIHGSVPFLGACQKAVIEGKNQVPLVKNVFSLIFDVS